MQEGGNIMRDVKNFLMDEDGQGMVEVYRTGYHCMDSKYWL